jgi:hypothetical protein
MPSPDLAQWWLSIEGQGQPLGPMDIGAVLGMVRQGRVNAATLACPVGGREWKPLQAWPTFAPHLATATGPPPAPPRSGRTTARRLSGLPRSGARRGNATLAFKLLILGISLGLATGGGLFAWWWFGGSSDLPRESTYLPDDTSFILTLRLGETRRSPFAVHLLKQSLTEATQRKFGPEWEKDFEHCLGVPPGYVEMMLFSAGKKGDWLLILRLSLPLNTQDVQNARQAGTARKDLKFEADNAYRHPVFQELRTGPSTEGNVAGPCFCMPNPMVILMAPRKDLLGDALVRNRFPRLAAPLKSAVAQANFSRDLALALNLKADAIQPWKDALWSELDPLQPPDLLQEAESVALDFQRDGQQLRGTFFYPTPAVAETLREKGQTWLEKQTKAAGERKETANFRTMLQGLAWSVREHRLLFQGPIPAVEEWLREREKGEKAAEKPAVK